jgi:hypothetical protein
MPWTFSIRNTLQTVYPTVTLGTNTAARQHAEDMLEHRFVSGWGTDGTTPDE